MDKPTGIDKDVLIPIGIGILSILGIGVIFMLINPGRAHETATQVPATATFHNPFLATTTPTNKPRTETPATTQLLERKSVTATPVTMTVQPSATFVYSSPLNPTATPLVYFTPIPTNTPGIDETTTFPAGTYDDIDERITYEGGWVADTLVKDAYQETIFVSTVVSSSASFLFAGQLLKIGYFGGEDLGTITITIDNETYTLDQSFGREWTSPHFPYGEHSVLIVHESGDYIVLDYVSVVGSP